MVIFSPRIFFLCQPPSVAMSTPVVLLSSKVQQNFTGVTPRTKVKCFAFVVVVVVVVLLPSQVLIIRAVVEQMLSHVELHLSYGQQPKALTLQYPLHGSNTLHGPKYITWIKYIAWTQIQIHCMDQRHCMDPNTNTLHGSITLHGSKSLGD